VPLFNFHADSHHAQKRLDFGFVFFGYVIVAAVGSKGFLNQNSKIRHHPNKPGFRHQPFTEAHSNRSSRRNHQFPFNFFVYLLQDSRYNIRLNTQKDSAFIFKARESESEACWELTFIAKDRPGLFSDFAGVLALKNINILSAQIYTWRDGTAVDIFKVTHPLDAMNPEESWKRVERNLKDTFTGKLSLEYRLGQKSAPSILLEGKKPEHPPQVIIDNEVSDFFTLIEVFADDRVGLLYLITRCLFDLRLDIRISKIATKGDQVADVFYVRDLEGQKLEDKEQLLEIERALLHCLM